MSRRGPATSVSPGASIGWTSRASRVQLKFWSPPAPNVADEVQATVLVQAASWRHRAAGVPSGFRFRAESHDFLREAGPWGATDLVDRGHLPSTAGALQEVHLRPGLDARGGPHRWGSKLALVLVHGHSRGERGEDGSVRALARGCGGTGWAGWRGRCGRVIRRRRRTSGKQRKPDATEGKEVCRPSDSRVYHGSSNRDRCMHLRLDATACSPVALQRWGGGVSHDGDSKCLGPPPPKR
jgi:hypothetical protein